MLPPGRNDLARQIALRVFHATLYADAFASCGFSDIQTIPPTVFPDGECMGAEREMLTSSGSYDKTMPSNYYENDLSLPERLTIAPLSVKSVFAWSLYPLALLTHL